ncbi:hypothetical protein B0T25DRAFT_175488 [Lasiosphaeria hispida]|uniref:Myb-like domain-containing protein n=1 Tax=Lasiosphaeria hispida TaxID=260671 RepID=A0AAJ0HNH8_9PEZI|nr:hypothetical protein B0T25DRAFT_175488 [Lasiosphaeria hispida]
MFISVAAQSHAAWPGPDSDVYTTAAASAIFPTWEQFNFSQFDFSQLIAAPIPHNQTLYEMPSGSACMPNRRAEMRLKTQSKRAQQARQLSTPQQNRDLDLAVSNDAFYGTQLRGTGADETFMPGDGYAMMTSQNNYPSHPPYVSHQPPVVGSRKESHYHALPAPGYVELDDFVKPEPLTQAYWSPPVPADLTFSSFAPSGDLTRWQPSFQELQDPMHAVLGYHQYGITTIPHGIPQMPFEEQAAAQTTSFGSMATDFRSYSSADSGSSSTFGSFSSTGASEMLESMVLSDEPTHTSWLVPSTGNMARDSMTTALAPGLRSNAQLDNAAWGPPPSTPQVPTVSPKLLRLRPSPTITPTSSSESILTAFFKGSRDSEQSVVPVDSVSVETENKDPPPIAQATPSASSASLATSAAPTKFRKLLPSFESRRRQSPPNRSKDSAGKASANARKPSRHRQSSHKAPSPPPIKRKTSKQKCKPGAGCDSLGEAPIITPPPPQSSSRSPRKSLRLSQRLVPPFSPSPAAAPAPALTSAPILTRAPTHTSIVASATASASVAAPAQLAPLAPRPKKAVPACPAPTRFIHVPTQPPSAIVVTPAPDPIPRGFATRAAADEYLIRNKKAGWTYKDIRRRGGFIEAESTLRGRYRTLTKSREQRVRKPAWSGKDLHLLEIAVRILAKPTPGCVTVDYPSSGYSAAGPGVGDGYSMPIPMVDLNIAKVPWKQVAEYISGNGGSYRFGNSTCRKRWDKLVSEQVAAGKDANRPFYEQPGKPIQGDRKLEKGKKKSEKTEEMEEVEDESDESESEDDDVEME